MLIFLRYHPKKYSILYRFPWLLIKYFCFWSLRPHNFGFFFSSSDCSCILVITLLMCTIWIFWNVNFLNFDGEIFSNTFHRNNHFFTNFFCSFGFPTYCKNTLCLTSNCLDFFCLIDYFLVQFLTWKCTTTKMLSNNISPNFIQLRSYMQKTKWFDGRNLFPKAMHSERK